MAEVKISQLPLKNTSFAGTEEFAINDGGTTKKTTLDAIYARVGSLASITSPLVNTSIVAAINSLYALDASSVQRGLMSTTAQVFSGDKTFNNNLILDGNSIALKSGTGKYTVLKAATNANYTLWFPASTGSAGQALLVNGASELYFGNVVTSITAGTGLTGGTITSTGTIALATTGTSPGSYGSNILIPIITVDAYGRLTFSSQTTVRVANSSQSGFISATDWNTFNNKLNVPSVGANACVFWTGSALDSCTDFLYDQRDGFDQINVPYFNIKGGLKLSSYNFIDGANYVILPTDFHVIFKGSIANDFTLTLPKESDLSGGETYIINVIDNSATSVKIQCPGMETINGSGSLNLNPSGGYVIIKYIGDPDSSGVNKFVTLSYR